MVFASFYSKGTTPSFNDKCTHTESISLEERIDSYPEEEVEHSCKWYTDLLLPLVVLEEFHPLPGLCANIICNNKQEYWVKINWFRAQSSVTLVNIIYFVTHF